MSGANHWAAPVLAAVMVVASSNSDAFGQEVCVSCSEPRAVYRCMLDSSLADVSFRGRGRALEFVCITEIAKRAPHGRCSVSRDHGQICLGQDFVLSPATLGADDGTQMGAAVRDKGDSSEYGVAPPVPPVGTAAKPATIPREKEPRRSSAGGPPETLEELARDTVDTSKRQIKDAGRAVDRTVKSAGETIEQAGSSVGRAAEKTWRCLTSLLSRC